MPPQVWACWNYVFDHYRDGFDAFVKADDDTCRRLAIHCRTHWTLTGHSLDVQPHCHSDTRNETLNESSNVSLRHFVSIVFVENESREPIGGPFVGARRYVIGAVCSIMAAFNAEELSFRDTMDRLDHFMRLKSLPLEMRGRLRAFFRHRRSMQRDLSYDSLLARPAIMVAFGLFILRKNRNALVASSI